jgi:lipid-A-disaccharide synthase
LTARGNKILIVSGEASGDLHGAEVTRAIRALAPETRIYAMGGENLRQAEAEIIVDSGSLAVVGVTEVLGRLRGLLGALRRLKEFLRREKPDLLLLIDFPDFNMRLARAAKGEGVPVLYYISPQVWAWRAGRVKTLARLVEKMAVIFPFEAPLYEAAGVPVEFVGHPLLDALEKWEAGRRGRKGEDFAGEPLIALLPGSREKEVSSLLPEMVRAADILKRDFPQMRFLLPLASTIGREFAEQYIPPDFPELTLVEGKTYEAVAASDLAIVASGTATLETALLGKPMVIVYRVSPVSFWLGRALIRVKSIGLANIVAGKGVVPELIQEEACGERIAEETRKILSDPERRRKMEAALTDVRKKLGAPGAAARVARIALELTGSGAVWN